MRSPTASAALGRARRLTASVAGAGMLLTALPAGAAVPRSDDEPAALEVLERAARASWAMPYSGTKFVAAWHPAGTTTSLVDVRNDPLQGTTMTASPTAAGSGDQGDDVLLVTASALDERLLQALVDSYRLRRADPGRCAGRTAEVVEAVRDGDVAGRFWVDADSGLLLRREVYDHDGRRVRSSAFVDLVVGEAGPSMTEGAARRLTRELGRPVPLRRLADMREDGWHVPDELPGGMQLFEARTDRGDHDGRVLHLAYSDGLSTASLFVQAGAPGDEPPAGFVRRDVGGHPTWVRDGAPERVVWGGGGRVWTLVTDAPASAVDEVVAALPHDEVQDDGLRARMARGLSRLGGWLNPFD
ncbi:MAG: sigma-E factor regulatory protein RseB domain-containing protein [Actinomycetes bacterium]